MVVIGVPLKYSKMADGRSILYLSERVRRTFQKAGGYVLPLAPVQDVDYINTRGCEFIELSDDEKNDISYSLSLVDGIVFTGGNKFTPYDRYVLEECISKKIPVLGICLGMQMMSCYKEEIVLEENISDINHYQESDEGFSHKVKISSGTKLHEIIGKEEIEVNSFHKYHVTDNKYYYVNAVSEDGLIEGLEFPGESFNLGIQWHPEISYDFDEDSRKIIDYFISACEEYKNSKCK